MMDMRALKIQTGYKGKEKVCVWGTGAIANAFIFSRFETVDAFIDNNKEIQGQKFYDKIIMHPDEISNWKALFIIIAAMSADTITKQLQSYGLVYGDDFIVYNELLETADVKHAEREISNSIKRIKSMCFQDNSTIVFNDHALNDKHENEYYKSLIQAQKNESFLFVYELGGMTKCSMDDTPVLSLPEILVRNLYPRNNELCKLNSQIEQAILQKPYLEASAKHLRYKNRDLQPQCEYLICYFYIQFIYELFECIKPSRVIVRTSFDAYHSMLIEICHELGIEVIHTEFGVLSGTIVFEKGGEMGESFPTLYSNEFFNLPVTCEEYNFAGSVWEYLSNSGLNRNKQDKKDFERLITERIKKDRPTIFYAGQADWGSGIQPYTERTKKYHSPVFHSSIEAAIYLSELCDKNDWNFIYKPHPRMYYECGEEQLSPNVIRGDGIGINYLIDCSDLVITILSQTAYISLIRRKPTLILGYMQLIGKECAYEAYEKAQIEKTIIHAMKEGFDKQKQAAFQKHISQILKYYVYDDNVERELRFGKKMPQCFAEIDDLPNNLKSGKEK